MSSARTLRRAWGTTRRRLHVLGLMARRGPALPWRRLQREIAAGTVPEGYAQKVGELLNAADDAWDAGRVRTAAFRLEEALTSVFHPALHFGARAALAEDPDALLAPLRSSVTYRALTRTQPRATGPSLAPTQRRLRLLVVSYGGWTFAQPIVDAYRQQADVQVRTLDLADLPDPRWQPLQHDLVYGRLAGTSRTHLPRDLRAVLDGADVILVEWGHRQAAWVSQLPALRARVVVRLHSYEAFTLMPQVTDWSAVCDVVFVAPPIRALAEATVPGLHRPRRHTVPNLTDLEQYRRPKTAAARRTMALIGWNTVNKDPAWALDVLDELLATDPEWRLLLVGHDLPAAGGEDAAYTAAVTARIEALGSHVVRTGFRDDIAEVLRDVGVVLSASRREGTHESLIQGAASGALPVVRDWPAVARWGGPRSLFPGEWVVPDPDAAAVRILTAEGNPQLTRDAQHWALSHLDAAAVWPRLDSVLRGPVERS